MFIQRNSPILMLWADYKTISVEILVRIQNIFSNFVWMLNTPNIFK